MIFRPVTLEDLDQLEGFIQRTGGLTTLPPQRDILERIVRNSVNSFAISPTKPGDETYLFVLEDIETNKIVGTSGIYAKVGGYEPFYSYEIEKVTHESKSLDTKKEFELLSLKLEHNGPTEICSLLLDPEYRGRGLGRLLSLSRFLFMAEFKERFEKTAIAEMRGVVNEEGKSPFWVKVVRPFFDMDYEKADFLSTADKSFIADLMPKHPIYLSLLPEDAKEVIGKVHRDTAPDLRLLYQEGFEFDNHVDIFDAGPRIASDVSEIRTIKDSKHGIVKDIILEDEIKDAQPYLASNTSINFKAFMSKLAVHDDGTLTISKALAYALHLKHGDTVRYVPAHPSNGNSVAEASKSLIFNT